MNDCMESTIIIGGGIIGLSTAYYLASSANSSSESYCISVVDSSPAAFVAASGGATGILGDYGFEPEAEALGVLSWNLHKELAEAYDGPQSWGFSDIVIQNLYNKSQHAAPIEAPNKSVSLPSWFKGSDEYGATFEYGADHAARM